MGCLVFLLCFMQKGGVESNRMCLNPRFESIMLSKSSSAIKQRWRLGSITFGPIDLVLLVGFLILSVAVFIWREDVERLGAYGYIGAFVVALIGNSTFIPTPYWIVIGILGTVLNPVLVGIVAGFGATFGDGVGYMLGYTHRADTYGTGHAAQIANWVRRHGGISLFLLALIPNPFFVPAAVIAGASRFGIWKFFGFTFAGRLPKMLFYANAGVWILALFSR